MPSKAERMMGIALSPPPSNKPSTVLRPKLSEIRVSSRTNSIMSAFSGSSYISKFSGGSQQRAVQKLGASMKQQYEVVLSPLFNYMRVLGLTCYTDSPALRLPLMIYNIVIMIVMNSYSILNISQIEFIELNVNFAFATIHACYIASGGICSLFLFWMQKSFNRLSNYVVQQVALCDPDFQRAARIHQMCKLMVALTIFWGAMAVLSTLAIHNKMVQAEERDVLSFVLSLIHYYVAFLTQSALMSWSVFFALPCYILATCVDAFIQDMHHDGIELDGKWTNSEAVEHVLKYKRRYRGLKKAADVIEEQFKYAIAYVEALCFTELCFVLYTYLKDESAEKTWIDTMLCASYAINILFHMTFFTAPAYRLYERNQTISAIATTMFQEQMHRNPDQFLACLLLLFGHVLQAAEITLTAGGFFVVTRQLILTLVSLVLTYVVIMLQFGNTPGGCLIRNTARFNASLALERF